MKSFFKVWVGISLMAIGFGIALLIIAFTFSGFRQVKETTNLHESYEGVRSIAMDIDYRAVEIVKGDRFSIDAGNVVKDELVSYVEDGTWYIKENNKKRINLFGLKLPLEKIFDWNNDYNITITIPEDFVADQIDFNVKAGALDAELLKAKTCNLDVKSGRIRVQNLIVTESSDYYVGAGEIKIDQINAKDIDMSCGVGNIDVAGIITGKNNSINNSVGNVKLNLDGKITDYSYEVSCEVGEVIIGDSSYNKLSNKIINKNDATNHLNLDCSVGKITVKFN